MNSLLIHAKISSLVGEREGERDILKLIIKTFRCHLDEHFLADECMEYLDEADPLPLMKSSTTFNVLQAIETSRKRLMTETSFLYTTMPRSTLAKQWKSLLRNLSFDPSEFQLIDQSSIRARSLATLQNSTSSLFMKVGGKCIYF